MKNGRYEDEWCIAYYKNDVLHREDGPAYVNAFGEKRWYIDGKLHRLDGPASEGCSGQEWYVDGKLHRRDGPAIVRPDGIMTWYNHGRIHRLDGPAMEYPDGAKQWFIDGQYVDITGATDITDIFGYRPSIPLTEEEQMVLRLRI